jgi:phytoene synthase
MAWWRERLEDLEKDMETPAEPHLQAIASELLPRGISGRELSRLENAWLPLLEPFPWGAEQSDALKLRGRILFGIGALLLGETAADAEPAGVVWSLVDGAQHCTDPQSRDHLLGEARKAIASNSSPGRLRPLTTLGALAVSDAKGGGNAARMVAALKHRITGRFS